MGHISRQVEDSVTESNADYDGPASKFSSQATSKGFPITQSVSPNSGPTSWYQRLDDFFFSIVVLNT